jgi:heptosyltransferase-2/heptosyltransferase-3
MSSPRPLVVRCGAMGDMVMILSLVDLLSRRFGTPVDVLSSGGWTRPLLAGQAGVGELYLVGSRQTPFWLSRGQREVAAALAARPRGPVWIADKGRWPVSIVHRAGYPRDLVLVAHRDCRLGEHEHHIDRWLRFGHMTPRGLPAAASPDDSSTGTSSRSPPLQVSAAARAELDAWLAQLGVGGRRLVLVQAGNKRTMRWWAPRSRSTNTKYWPEERWGEVIRRVLDADAESRVLLLGVPAEAPLNDAIAAATRSDRVLNVARELPIPRLLALQERASGMLSVDTGPAHSAAALDCPLVVLFGEANVVHYLPRSPSGHVEAVQGIAGGREPRILSISVDDVWSAWCRLPVMIGRGAAA